MTNPRPLLLATAALITLACPAQADLSPAPPQLLEWKAEVERSEKELADLYGYKPAPVTLQKAFASGGVEWSQRYSQAWGGWIFMDYSVARKLHQRTIHSLQDTINKARSRQALPANHMGQLSQMMRDFRSKNLNYQSLFQERLKHNVTQGLALDRKQYHKRRALLARQFKQYILAELHEETAEEHAARAEEARKRGQALSQQIRAIGHNQPLPSPTPSPPNAVALHPIIIR